MIDVDVSMDLQKITDQIDGVWFKAPTILKNAANATGRYAMKQMIETSEHRYDYRVDGARLSEHLHRKSATYANPYSLIKVAGKMNPLTKFHVNPMKLSHGNTRPRIYAAHVLKGHSDVALEGSKNKSKAFAVKFKSGHIAIVQRLYGETYKNPEERVRKHLDPTKIVENKTVSPMHMASKVYDLEEDAIGKKLQHYTQMYIDKFMKARASI